MLNIYVYLHDKRPRIYLWCVSYRRKEIDQMIWIQILDEAVCI